MSSSTCASQNWKDEKERLGKLSTEERRNNYFCNVKECKGINDIQTWSECYTNSNKNLIEKVSDHDHEQFAIDYPELSKTNSAQTSKLASKVSVYVGDITKLEIDAIVNAANETLLGGGGVDGAIHEAAGNMLLEECCTLDGCEIGQAKITCGYKLPSKNVIHTVGPKGVKPAELLSCYNNSLNILLEQNLRTIAFPCISAGFYGYPLEKSAPIAINAARSFLEENLEKVDRIIFTLFQETHLDIYEKQMQLFFPLKQDGSL